MPPEILNRIAQFVDGRSILPLCHALPYYKYISAAMFEFVHRFPFEGYSPYGLWPDMRFPMLRSTDSEITEFPIQHLHAAAVYIRIVSKHGGIVYVPCSKNIVNYMGAMPDVVSVFLGSDFSSWGPLLRGLADVKTRIRTCTVEVASADVLWGEIASSLKRLSIQSLVWEGNNRFPVEVLEVLPDISGLSYLELCNPMDINENSLSRCSDLKEISFSGLLSFVDGANQVEDILRRIRGSPIQKV
ncbi:hypothetical protein HDU77_001361, partial [Chytriomyces hyalinus]